jgi:hypothetical protein
MSPKADGAMPPDRASAEGEGDDALPQAPEGFLQRMFYNGSRARPEATIMAAEAQAKAAAFQAEEDLEVRRYVL